jgi:hypothetical protein
VSLVGREFPSALDWSDHMALARQVLALTPATEPSYALAFSDGAGPTAEQRRAVTALVGGRPVRGALITTSRLARGIGAIFRWIEPEYRIFAPRELGRALRHIGIPEPEWPALLAVVHEANQVAQLGCVRELPAVG